MARRLPADRVTFEEAGHILGLTIAGVSRRVRDGRLVAIGGRGKHGRLTRAAVEALALSEPRPSMYTGSASYWVNTKGAADVLGVVRQRVTQLAKAGGIPFETTSNGRRLFRREQLGVVANARHATWHGIAAGE